MSISSPSLSGTFVAEQQRVYMLFAGNTIGLPSVLPAAEIQMPPHSANRFNAATRSTVLVHENYVDIILILCKIQ